MRFQVRPDQLQRALVAGQVREAVCTRLPGWATCRSAKIGLGALRCGLRASPALSSVAVEPMTLCTAGRDESTWKYCGTLSHASSTALLFACTGTSALGLAPEKANTAPLRSRSRSASLVRADRIGPTTEALLHWNIVNSRVTPPSTVSSTTMSAWLRPACGRAT